MANETMRYETILVLNPTLGEETVAALGEKFKSLIAEHGEIEKVEEWGKRRLAYPIEDETEGYYILIYFSSSPDFPAELNRVYDITEGVLRTLIVRNEVEQQPAPAPAAPAPVPAAVAKEEAPEAEAPAEEVPAEEAAPVAEAQEEETVEENSAEEAPVEEAPADVE